MLQHTLDSQSTLGTGLDHSTPLFLICCCAHTQIRQQLGIQAVVIAPAAAATTAATTATPATPATAAAAAATLSFKQELTLHPHPTHEPKYALAGATAAGCVLCAVDQACGLLQALSLSPVLVLVGVARGPALSSGETLLLCYCADHHGGLRMIVVQQ
jgi:hypothetical protein